MSTTLTSFRRALISMQNSFNCVMLATQLVSNLPKAFHSDWPCVNYPLSFEPFLGGIIGMSTVIFMVPGLHPFLSFFWQMVYFPQPPSGTKKKSSWILCSRSNNDICIVMLQRGFAIHVLRYCLWFTPNMSSGTATKKSILSSSVQRHTFRSSGVLWQKLIMSCCILHLGTLP